MGSGACVWVGRSIGGRGNALERQADTSFEIAAGVAHPDIAAKVDHLVAELHFNSAGKLAAEGGAVWPS